MINHFEMPMYIQEAIPELSQDIEVSKKGDPYVLINSLVAFTCKNIKQHNFLVVKRCFKIADMLYRRGNGVVQNAVQNVFVYSFTKMFQCYPEEKEAIMAIVPMTLYSLYIGQVCHNGC